MTPEELERLERIEELLKSVALVEDPDFIDNIKRRGGQGLRTDGTTSASTITISVRNAADDGSETVCDNPDTKLKVVTPAGTVYYLPAFTS